MVGYRNTPLRHRRIAEAHELMQRGRMDRREFLRVATLLGASVAAASVLAGYDPALAADAELPFPADEEGAKSGGTLRIGMEVQAMHDPATYDWTQMSNQTRHIAEYLTITGPDNITRPMLASGWTASEDLKTWTFTLRKGVQWHTGEELNALDVKWNIERWCRPETGSSIIGLPTFSAMTYEVVVPAAAAGSPAAKVRQLLDNAIEVIDRYTLRLNLVRPNLSVPEDFYHYPAAILHPSFVPPFSENPIGTGPFTLGELVIGESCRLERVRQTRDGKAFVYWGGKVYLDAIHYLHFDGHNQLAGFASGQLDAIYGFDVEELEFAKRLDGVAIAARTAQTCIARMQVDQKPFDDVRVRRAIQKAVDRAAIKAAVFPAGGDVGEDHHVSPVHPEYFELPALVRDVEGARTLLNEAGYGDGLELTIAVGNASGRWESSMLEVMRGQLAEAGIKLAINVLPTSEYWKIWDKTPFGATSWTHRPLGIMVPSLAYKSGVPWNETHYANPDLDTAIEEAAATLDVEARRAKMEVVQKILQEAAIFIQPIWRPVYTATRKTVHSWPPHPTQYHQLNKVWIEG
jgi:peptide/nickel transport system substrate-binding protein